MVVARGYRLACGHGDGIGLCRDSLRRIRFPDIDARQDPHIFVDPGIDVIDVKVPNTELERVASDHLPLLADIRL